MQTSGWLFISASLFVLCAASVRSTSDVAETSPIESSIVDSSAMMASLRFYGVTKTVKTTTTVVHLYTSYVHATCLSIPAGTKPCSATTTPAPTTTTTPAPTTSTTTTTTTTTPSPTTTPPFKVVEGQFKPSVSTNITVNKLTLPKLHLNLPSPFAPGSGIGNFFGGGNRQPVNMTMTASVSATFASGNGRRRRSEIIVESIDPSLVRGVEMTAIPDASAVQQDVAIETSKAEDEDYHEYEIIGLMPHHFSGNDRGLPLLDKLTIVRMDPVTVTVSQTVTSKFPFESPADRVTLAYTGCIPPGVPNLPNCA